MTANAVPVYHDESIDGPLTTSPPFSFNAGTNVILGQSCYTDLTVSPCGPASIDEFRFIIGGNELLTAVRLTIFDFEFENGDPVFFQGNLFDPIGFNSVKLLTGTRSFASFDGGPGQFRASVGSFRVGVFPSNFLAANYMWQFDVIAVPEPSTLALLPLACSDLA